MGSRIARSRGIGGGVTLIILGIFGLAGAGGDIPLWCPGVAILLGLVILVTNLMG